MAEETTGGSNGAGADPEEVAALRGLASALIERYQFAQQHSLSYWNSSTGKWQRDRDQALGYPDKLDAASYRGRYERGGIAERIVEAYPDATWPTELYFEEDQDPDTETPFEADAADIVRDLDLWSVCWRADVLKELGHYSVILIGAPGRLDEEMPQLSGPEDIQYLAPYGENAAKIKSLVGESGTEEDMANPRFGLPKEYEINFAGSAGGSTSSAEHTSLTLTKTVHWSRVIHLAEGALENGLYGKPRLRSVWNLLNDLYKVTGGGSEAAWRNMDPKRMWNIHPDIQATAQMKSDLKDAIEEMRHGLESDIRAQGVDLEQLASNVHNFGPNAKAIVEQIAATTGIPQRILMGSERGELASGQDRSNWSDRVDARWSRFGGKTVRAFMDRLIEYGGVSAPADDYEIIQPPRDEPTDENRADVTAKVAKANLDHKSATGRPLFTAEQILDRFWDMEDLVEDEDFLQQPDEFLPDGVDPDPLTEQQGRSRPN